MTDTAPLIRQVNAAEAIRLAADGYRILDVREPSEWDTGHIPGATLLPLGELPARMAEVLADRDERLLVHCAVGARSARAAGYLGAHGYGQVVSLHDSLGAWRAAGGAWEEPVQPLTEHQSRRYSRQMLLPEVGTDGQRRLLDARVLVIGAGGLGSPAALYLAAAGVGTIGLVDDDVVDLSNLQRQVLHTTGRIGQAKTASARVTLEAINPDVRVVEHREHLDARNAERLLSDYDVIVDGTDRFGARYLINDAAVRLRKPLVHASVYRWEGQVTTILPFQGPCYRCLHPSPPPGELVPACSVAGVMGTLPGLAGTLQANEVLKLVLGTGDLLVGRLLMIDARAMEFREIRVPRDPDCPACGLAVSAAPA
ncbi:MAG TPA: molybdopterin-synthase adenylyltransferase MoeB [Candidatus Limnocylindria bacterium]|nr:molybdopterin-synthase adenylyltransferase MoeB [Candidatus Limnocylindria bacterium]